MVEAHGVEVAVAVAEMADVAWGALERHRDHAALSAIKSRETVAAEDALEHERLVNERLRAAIEVYETALRKEVERQGSQLSVGESFNASKEDSLDMYTQLKKRLESPDFLHKLKVPPDADPCAKSAVMKTKDGVFVTANLEDPNWWLWVSENDMFTMEPVEDHDGLDSEGYVLVHQEDFIDGMASFLARYISSMPKAKKMSPKELQDTILKAFTKAEKKGKLRKIWKTGKLLYTATSWGATVLGLYRHPLVLRAASMAVWTTCCLILQILK